MEQTMAQMHGIDTPIGSAAMAGESGSTEQHRIVELETRLRTARATERETVQAAEQAIRERADLEIQMLRAQRERAMAEIRAATQVDRSALDRVIGETAAQVRTRTAIAIADGGTEWPQWLRPALEQARSEAGPDEMAGVILHSNPSASVQADQPRVALVVDVTGRIDPPRYTERERRQRN